MAVTFLQAVNRVLVKLREGQVTTLNGASDYPLLIAAYVNEAKEEVETAWQWSYLRTSVDITTVAGQDTYSITGVGEEFVLESVYDITSNTPLYGPSPNFYVDRQIVTTTLGAGGGSYYVDVVGMDTGGDPQLRLTPAPASSGNTIRVYGRKKQAYLETSSDDNTLIELPWKPVVYGAYVRALSERGEDGGAVYDEAVRQFDMALATAIGLDSRNSHINTDWFVD